MSSMWNLSSGQRPQHIRALRTSRKRFNQQESRSADRSIGPRGSCALNEIVSAAPDATWPQSWMQRENWEFETHSLSLPTGDHGFSSDGANPSFLFAFAHDFRPGLSLGYNSGAAWESSAAQPDRDAFIVYSLALGVRLTDRLGTFLELFGDRQVTGPLATSASMDGGLTLLLTDIVQLDVYAGSGLRGPTSDLFAGTGLSFRLPR